MEKIDLRTLTPGEREQIRRMVIRLYKQGKRQIIIAQELGLRPTTVCHWITRFKHQGTQGFEELKRGRPVGNGRLLTAQQEVRIQQDIVDKTPDQLKLKYALWSAQAVRLLINHHFDLDVPVRTVRKYLQRWGFTPQRPLKRAYEQQPKAVQQWLQESYPAIKRRARDEGGDIHWGDETAVSSVEHHPRGYAPKGKTPVLVLSQAKRERVNLISSITNQGKVRFMSYEGRFTAPVMIKFLQRLLKDSEKKIFLIVDNLRVHHSRKVKAWLKDKESLIELFYLPSYSPELNPDEYLNGDLKARLNAGEPVRDKKQMKKKLLSQMRAIQNKPQTVRNYFQAEKVRYAA